jgi:hypothetical protein
MLRFRPPPERTSSSLVSTFLQESRNKLGTSQTFLVDLEGILTFPLYKEGGDPGQLRMTSSGNLQ